MPTILVSSFGTPSGNNDGSDTGYIQAAINSCSSGDTLLFEPKVYSVSMLLAKQGITYNLNGCTFIKPPNSAKFDRTFTFHNTLPKDHRTIIQNGHFDGNIHEQGAYLGFEKEQQHALFIDTAEGYIGHFAVFNCTFFNIPADAVSVFRNSVVDIRQCKLTNTWRSAIAVTNNDNKVTIRHCDSDSMVNYEPDGYVGTRNVLNVLDSKFKRLEFSGKDGDTLWVENCYFSGPSNIYHYTNCVSKIRRCYFGGELEVYHPGILEIKDSTLTSARIIWGSQWYDPRTCSFVLDSCEFVSTTYMQQAILGSHTKSDKNKHLKIRNCRFSNSYDYIYFSQGGNMWFENNIYHKKRARISHSDNNPTTDFNEQVRTEYAAPGTYILD